MEERGGEGTERTGQNRFKEIGSNKGETLTDTPRSEGMKGMVEQRIKRTSPPLLWVEKKEKKKIAFSIKLF